MYQSKRIDDVVIIKALEDGIKYNESISNRAGIKRCKELLELVNDIKQGELEQLNIIGSK